MNAMIRRSVQLGELVAAVYDEAGRYSDNPKEVSSLAARTVTRMLRRAANRPSPRK
jgi:hypothetical protein